ncbi:MAG: DUF4166 domain-containing protein [Steroidobacteraceae bacterium]
MKPETGAASADESPNSVWYVYDGECPICNVAANALRIRQDVGPLLLLNARETAKHPLLDEINAAQLNLDEGMVIKFRDRLYHGADALHLMALIGSEQGWFNRMNAFLYRSKTIAAIIYPSMRATRNALIWLKGAPGINNLAASPNPEAPIFADVFGAAWTELPSVMKNHYCIRTNSEDRVTVEGTLDIYVSWLAGLIARVFGTLVAHSAKNVPVTVTFRSGQGTDNGRAFYFDRVFNYKHGIKHFRSRMLPIGGNELVEIMRFGIGWKLAYLWDGKKIILEHRGYVLRIGQRMIRLPLEWLIGRGYAEEHPESNDTFSMLTYALHPWFGKTFAYSGRFKISQMSCKNPS